MPSLIQSIFDIIQGLINSVLAIIQSLVHVVETIIAQVVGLAKSLIAFVFHNIVILGLLGVAFVGYSVYLQQNRTAAPNRTVKKKL